ncbi:receptor-like protein 12 [Papaver somniferum]|uniref:receptor-like protein 12 n=1 Tax=Papaver somniferum TaxID=3469 RepID=UPI000E6F9266|nr:receptor-like protein 12 [Papaver somniferum]
MDIEFNKNTLFFLFFILFTYDQVPFLAHGCHSEERNALLSFKSFLQDPSNRLSSWQVGNHLQNCCAWDGIQCSGDTFHVISINLRNTEAENYERERDSSDLSDRIIAQPNTALKGKISLSLFELTHLEFLDLGFNDFQKSRFPVQLSNLTKLSHLDLSNTNILDSITTQLTNLSLLKYLDISRSLETFPYLSLASLNWLRGLVNLKVLRMRGFDLYKVTSSEKNFAEPISYLSNLRELDLSNCNISSPVFPVLFNLSRLSSLKMNANYINSPIPVQLSNLTALVVLELSNCKLRGSVPYLPQLRELEVSFNFDLRVDLTKMFLYQWPELRILSIQNTAVIQSIPSSISNAPLLVSLYASSCFLKGSIPSSISNLKHLNVLDLSANNLQGTIPSSICKMLSLRQLSLEMNNITGSLPSCIAKLRNLSVFGVYENSIDGNVSLISLLNGLNLSELRLSPNKLTVFTDPHLHLSKFKLIFLDLQSCNMSGHIPTFLCNFTQLIRLDLSHNSLTGAIPSCLSKHQTLRHLILSNNKLQGPLPLPPQTVKFFDLSSNKISGEISTETGTKLSNVEYIFLSGNELSGSLPSSLCSNRRGFKSTTRIMDLSNNKLSGSIPTSVGYCKYLESLNLGSNNLTGNVPKVLAHLESLIYLQLYDNTLNGTVLNFIHRFSNLEVLSLANNKFEGSIPAAIGSLNGLKIISLRSNKFVGPIPEEISHLHQLQILDLSLNSFTGLIPRKIGKLNSLRSRPDATFSLGSGSDLQLQMVVKGIVIQFQQLYSYSTGMDLSCNILKGNIPEEISLLKGLSMLNLSHNHLVGIIPATIGNMSGLESLDISFNRLSGHIPQSLTSIDALGFLNLSYNKLSGRIPRGTHFETLSLDGSAFTGNNLLCGLPSEKVCEADESIITRDTHPGNEAEEDGNEKLLLYSIVVLGFSVGFWGLFLVLLLKKEDWWFGYWRRIDYVAAKITKCLLNN